MKLTNKDIYKAILFFKKNTLSGITESFNDEAFNIEMKFESNTFNASLFICYCEEEKLWHCSLKPDNRQFTFCFSFSNDVEELQEVYIRFVLNIQEEIEFNNESLSKNSLLIYSFLNEQNQKFQKEILKEKVDIF